MIDSQTLPTWEVDPMNFDGEVSPLTLREVIERHGGEIWFEREKASDRSFFRLLIPAAAPQEALEPSTLLGRKAGPNTMISTCSGRPRRAVPSTTGC